MIHNPCQPAELPHDYPPLLDIEFDVSQAQTTTLAEPSTSQQSMSQFAFNPQPLLSSDSQQTLQDNSPPKTKTKPSTNLPTSTIKPCNSHA